MVVESLAHLFLRVAINITNEMRFPLDNSVCRVETTCPLVGLDNLVAIPSKLMRCIFDSTTPTVESRQLVCSYNLWKVFFHSCHVDSIGHDCHPFLNFLDPPLADAGKMSSWEISSFLITYLETKNQFQHTANNTKFALYMYYMPLSKWNKLCKRFQLKPTNPIAQRRQKITQVCGNGPDGEIYVGRYLRKN